MSIRSVAHVVLLLAALAMIGSASAWAYGHARAGGFFSWHAALLGAGLAVLVSAVPVAAVWLRSRSRGWRRAAVAALVLPVAASEASFLAQERQVLHAPYRSRDVQVYERRWWPWESAVLAYDPSAQPLPSGGR